MVSLPTALPLLASLLVPASSPDLWALGGMVPGEHSVGFRTLRFRDTSRPWPSSEDPTGTEGRPVQVSLWYPARATDGPPLTVRDYVLADWTGATHPSPSQEERASGAALTKARRAFEQGLDGPLTEVQWARALSAAGRARADALAAPGRCPLVLFEPGLDARSYLYVPLVEMLASHGYVVASLASFGRSESERLDFDLAGVKEQVADMTLALKRLRELPGVDASRIGLLGWSVGGVSQALLRMEAPREFRAAISLDSGTAYRYGADLLREAGGVDPARLSLPFLHLDTGRADARVPKDDGFYRAHRLAPTLRLELTQMRHGDVVLPSGVGLAAALGTPAPVGTRGLAEYVRAFLGAYLAGDARARARLDLGPADLGLIGVRVRDRGPEGEAEPPRPGAGESDSVPVTLDSDGWRIVGDLLVPARRVGEGTVPAVVLLNKAAGNRHAYVALAGQLARHGIASLRIDLRAHGDSTNLGRFVPPEGLALLKGSDRDVAAAVAMLREDPRIDPARVGLVGASYSGEAMVQASRIAGYAAAYVALSPGSLSDESIAAIDREHLPWLMVVSRDDRYLKEVAQALRDHSRTAEYLEVGGTEHATDLLAVHPDLAERIAVWLSHALRRPSGPVPEASGVSG